MGEYPNRYVRSVYVGNEYMQTVIETPVFIKDAAAIMSDTERREFIDHIANHPRQGDLIRGTGGLRKIRWGVGAQGKSGGARIIYYYHSEDVPIFLITAYAKSDKGTLTDKERKQIRGLGKQLASAYGP